MQAPHLLPRPRRLRLTGALLRLPSRLCLEHDASLATTEIRSFTGRLNKATDAVQVCVKPDCSGRREEALIKVSLLTSAPAESPEAYELTVAQNGLRIACCEPAGLRAAVATLCQLLRQYGRRMPCLSISDWPDFPRRGVMLDISRGRVPRLATLKQLATDLAGFKINELQLYVEHTFAYRGRAGLSQGWGAISAGEVRRLDAHCQALGIDLVPNQNSFGHLRHWLEHKRFKPLGEVREPYPSADGTFLRYPSTLAPNHRGTLPFLSELYDELLPNFSSGFFNVGCDETWDLGRGQSKATCRRKGQGRVYLDFLLKIQREVQRRGRTMMCWGDIILKYPELIRRLPRKIIALNWGYEADHPFQREARLFAKAGIPFYVCPGTSSWQTLIGRNDNAFRNLRAAARAGKRNGALGCLITDWGDGGHPQPLIVSYPAFVAGASTAWCLNSFPEDSLVPVLSRDVFHDSSGKAATALINLGKAHTRFRYSEPNATPFGATIAAPPSHQRELFCRNGLKYYASLSTPDVRAAWSTVARERNRLEASTPGSDSARLLVEELDLAARMAEESCRYLSWQKALANGQVKRAEAIARTGVRHLRQIKREFERHWPKRNKATPARCAAFLDWRIDDYRTKRLHYAPSEAGLPRTPRVDT